MPLDAKLPIGTTSAYAEKSLSRQRKPPRHQNYLRIRGEELQRAGYTAEQTELPPHTRRREVVDELPALAPGTTSAYAEKS